MEVVSYSNELLLFLFFVAVTAGFIDTLAGGGGLITIPAMIMCGIPPIATLATNKLQGSMGTATATLLLLKSKKISLTDNKPIMLGAFIGSIVGAIIVQFIDSAVLSLVIPIVLLFIAIYFLLSPGSKSGKSASNQAETSVRPMSHKRYNNVIVPSIGFYDGMFGPGTGSFFAMAGVFCMGHDLIHSTAVAKSLNLATNVGSLIVFLLVGKVVWLTGIVMMAGQVIGAWAGAHFLFKVNPLHLRLVVALMCTAMLLRYAYSML